MVDVAIVATPDDGSCGIGTYAGGLRRVFTSESDSISAHHFGVRLRSLNVFHYAKRAVSVGCSDNDIIHVQHEYGIFGPKSIASWVFFPILYLLAWLSQTPVVITLHSAWNAETIGPPLSPLKWLYVAANNRLLVSGASHIVFLSENCRDQFLDSVSLQTSSYDVIPHGVQSETVEMTAAEAKEIFGYSADDTLVVEPGYVRPEKGHDKFVAIARELPEYSFLIAGGVQSAEEETFLKTIRERSPENVRITGVLDDERFHAAFNAADLVVLPYDEVTQSGIMNWCVAYGCPVLGNESAYFDRLQNEWGCVEVVDTSNPTTAASAVEDLLADESARESLAEAMADYRESQSMETVVARHESLYRAAV